jgi:hypothetical protein
MDEELLAQLRALLLKQGADATATKPMPRPMTIGPAPSPASQSRVPPPQRGVMAALGRSAAQSPDTPMGMVNEMVNPIRAGAQAREFAGQAMQAGRRGNLGGAVGMGALAAMQLPGLPSPQRAIARTGASAGELAAQQAAMRNLSVAPEPRPYFRVPDSLMGFGRAPKGFDESQYPFEATVLVRWPDQPPMVDKVRGMNLEHALERGRRNWEGADIKPYQMPLPQHSSQWDPTGT